jgi:hypothetical protein
VNGTAPSAGSSARSSWRCAYAELINNGTKKHIEDWLASEGYPGESHAELGLHAYFDGKKFYPDKDGDGHGGGDPGSAIREGLVPVLETGASPSFYFGGRRPRAGVSPPAPPAR